MKVKEETFSFCKEKESKRQLLIERKEVQIFMLDSYSNVYQELRFDPGTL